jgi:high frequency lysogenization protein
VSAPIDRSGYAALALAGVVQAAALVHRTARGEPVDEAARLALLRTVPSRQADDLAEIFPKPADLQSGAALTVQALSGQSRTPEVLRYTLQLLELARALRGVPQVVEKLGRLLDGLDAAGPDEQRFSEIYQQTISTLGKRIQVTGEPAVLQQQGVADRIRALLLAGVRLAWLWHQLGGRRWHLVLRRRPLLVALRPISEPQGRNSEP